MSRALLYLWLTLLKRGALRFIRKLRYPSSAVGLAALIFAFSMLFHFRHAEFFREVIRAETLIGCALIMLGGSIFKGFLQRGLVFELPDVEFLFTGPFRRSHILLYRLLPGYLYSIAQATVFVVLFAPHLKHPTLMFGCLTLFQISCFHIAAGAAIFGGRISQRAHDRIRWMLLGSYALITLFYLRTAWDLKLIPAFLSRPLGQMFFYPAVSFPDIATASWVGEWGRQLVNATVGVNHTLFTIPSYVMVFSFAALVSLWVLLRMKGDLFESSLATSTRMAERRIRLQEGSSIAVAVRADSFPLPKRAWFQGVRAIVWKNLIVARRSRRELLIASTFTFIYVGFLAALRWLLRHYIIQGGELPERQVRDFDMALIGMLGFLAFLLQRSFPFDFRRDGRHLVTFRTLPVTPLGITLAELALPIICCLLFQAAGMSVLMLFARFDWRLILFVLLAFPAVALGLNGVWNAHYLLAATRRAGGKAESASPITLLMVVALSFLIFYPAGWLALEVGRKVYTKYSETLAVATWLVTQYLVDFLLILLLARLFQRFELSREG